MTDYELLDAVGGVEARFIEHAADAEGKKQWKKWTALAACLCLAVLGGFSLWRHTGRIQGAPLPPAAAEPDESPADAWTNAPAEPTHEGVSIPAVTLPEHTGTGEVEYDMIGLVVYNGQIYTQAETYWGADAERAEPLMDQYLGYASGSIDEWSDPEAYGQEFASTMAGAVYTVKGYDPDFRICVWRVYEGDDGKPEGWIEFLERLNGIDLAAGKDLFEDRLHLSERVEKVQWQSHADWNEAAGNYRDAEVDLDAWEAFLDAADQGEFVNIADSLTGDSIYDTPNQVHLILRQNDGTVIPLRLIEGGYVQYEPLGWYFVILPAEIFNPIFEACGGTR